MKGLTQRVWIAALVLPALVLVALTARSYQPFGGGDDGGRRDASTPFLDSTFTVMVALTALAVLVTVWVWLHAIRTRPRGKGSKAPYASLIAFAAFAAVAVLMWNILDNGRPAGKEGAAADLVFPQVLPQKRVPQPELERAPQVVWPLAIGLTALIAGVIVAVIVIERRRDRRGRERRPLEDLEQLVKALDEAIDDLRRDQDPRRAVIAAYARMEQALTVFGLPRKPAEAPYEYLHRVAKELEAEGPVEALTELFEVAKFSEHSVDETMRGRAIDALTAVRAEVRTTAAAT